MQNFLALGALPPDLRASGGFAPKPPASGGWGLRPHTPKTAPHCEFLATRQSKRLILLKKRALVINCNNFLANLNVDSLTVVSSSKLKQRRY